MAQHVQSSYVVQVRGILDAKGKVGLGVDGSSSNETVNLLDDCRIATYLQRSGGNPKGDFVIHTLHEVVCLSFSDFANGGSVTKFVLMK